MKILKQLILALLVIAATVAIWARFIPAARPWVEALPFSDYILPAQSAEAAPKAGAPRGPGGRSGPIAVVTQAVTNGKLNDRLSAIGDGQALRTVMVKPQVAGIITDSNFAAGAEVKAGDVLFRLDDAGEKIALERAKLLLDNAKDDLARLSQLQGSGAVTALRTREAQLALRSAELTYQQAEFDLEQRVITAPISGTLGLSDIGPGDRVTAASDLALITDRSKILIDFRLPERVITQISPNMPVEIIPLVQPDTALAGHISAIDNIVERASRTIRIQATLDNANDTFRSGMAFNVQLSLVGETFPAVPPLAVQWSSDGPFVWIAREGKAVKTPVVLRQRNATSVLVEGELSPGDDVVTEGVQMLRPGSEIKPVGQDPQAPTSDTPEIKS